MKALVTKRYAWTPGLHAQPNWIARHQCSEDRVWKENLTTWYGAFWAADHHVRYDCGRRSPSSGGYQALSETAQEPFWLTTPYTPGWYIRDGWGYVKLVNKGGVQKDPTPTRRVTPPHDAWMDQEWSDERCGGTQVSGTGYSRGGDTGEQG